jgi:hypothetical protein
MPSELQWLELWSRGPLGVRLGFFWSGDRYAHRLEWTGEGGDMLALESLEGMGHQFWPPSPPLQQLSLEPRESGRTCALLLGMAGRSHWSASVEARGLTLVFDVACRVQQPFDRLGSSYQIGSACQAVESVADRALKFIFSGGREGLLVEVEAGEGALSYEDRQAVFSVLPRGDDGPWPKLVRWRYEMRLTPLREVSGEGAAT